MKSLEKLNLLKAEILKQNESKLDGLLRLCESEIEKLFLLNVINYCESLFGDEIETTTITYVGLRDERDWTKGMQKNRSGCPVYPYSYKVEHHYFTFELIPQFEIALNGRSWRLDFLFDIKRHFSDSNLKICVECDGYDFHQKTLNQVDRDNLRDADLTTNGILFFRFSGSKIYNNSSFSAFKNIMQQIIELASK